jgi:hypothetical protein
LTEKQYKGRLAPVERWLDAVTDKDLKKGAAIVVVSGLFAAGAAYFVASKIVIPVAGMAGTVQAISAVSALITTLLGWIICTLIYHAVAHLLGGKGDRNRMFALTGYASVPALVQQFLRLINYALLNQSLATSTSLPEVLLSHLNFFSIIGLVLVALAVKLNYGVSGRKAALVALIPTIIGLALSLVTMSMYSSVSSEDAAALFGG